MYQNDWGGPGMMSNWGGGEHAWLFAHMPLLLAIAAPVILLVVLWSVVWKGIALWHAARRGQYWWFAILLVVNTMGILEIIYLFFVAKLRFSELFSTKEHHHHS